MGSKNMPRFLNLQQQSISILPKDDWRHENEQNDKLFFHKFATFTRKEGTSKYTKTSSPTDR